MTDKLEWDGDWNAVDSETERESLEKDLRRSMSPAHILYDLGMVAVGRRWRRDDILFRLEDGRFAQVHLTHAIEANPRWPSAEIFETFEAWKAVPVEDR